MAIAVYLKGLISCSEVALVAVDAFAERIAGDAVPQLCRLNADSGVSSATYDGISLVDTFHRSGNVELSETPK